MTKVYASYSRVGGLGDVFGGLLFFLVSSYWWRWSDNSVIAVLVVLAPGIWIIVKGAIQKHYYQSSGRVIQRAGRWSRILLIGITLLVGFFTWSLAFLLILARIHAADEPNWLRVGSSSAVLLALPGIVAKYLRGPDEYLVGISLLLYASAALYGISHARPYVPAGFLTPFSGVCALLLVIDGLKQHQRYLRLQKQMSALKGEA